MSVFISISSMIHGRHTTRGFTMMELLIVILLIGIVTTLAIPSMRSIMRRYQDLDAASRVTFLVNQVRSQATRRNRAYELTFRDFSDDQPQGLLIVSEAVGNTCQSLIEQANGIEEIARYPFGQTQIGPTQDAKAKTVGLTGIRKGNEGRFSLQEHTLCINSGGALYEQAGQNYIEVTGVQQMGVQLFVGDPPNLHQGPPRIVEFTFSNGASLQQK
jgi:prepilin-type N-terminal cleavage/methylation domain-containing protein